MVSKSDLLRRIHALEERVEQLERDAKIVVYDEIYGMRDWERYMRIAGAGIGHQYTKVGVSEIVGKILDRLNLKLEYIPPRQEHSTYRIIEKPPIDRVTSS